MTKKAVGEKVLSKPSGAVYRYCAPDSNRATAWREDRAVDADYFTQCIHERAARIAWIDRCVGLNHIDIHALALALCGQVSAGSTDDADGDARLGVGEDESVGIADRDRPLADHEIAR